MNNFYYSNKELTIQSNYTDCIIEMQDIKWYCEIIATAMYVKQEQD